MEDVSNRQPSDDKPFSRRWTLHQIWEYLNGELVRGDDEQSEKEEEAEKESKSN